jgi:hypothetical protein
MAKELTTKVEASYSKSGVAGSMSGTGQVTISGTAYSRGVLTVATGAGTAIPLGSVATPGYFIAHNLDGTNFVTIGNNGDPLPACLKAGEWCLFRFAAGITPHAIADTSPVQIEFWLLSD